MRTFNETLSVKGFKLENVHHILMMNNKEAKAIFQMCEEAVKKNPRKTSWKKVFDELYENLEAF